MIKLLIKHLIAEQAINVFFENIQKNLLSTITPETYYHSMIFSIDGCMYHFYKVIVKNMTPHYITIHFELAHKIPIKNVSEDVEVWYGESSPFTTHPDYLIETR